MADPVVERPLAADVPASAGLRPFRVHVDPSNDGSEVVSVVNDRIRAGFYRRIGIEQLLPSVIVDEVVDGGWNKVIRRSRWPVRPG
ncbi:hypothetical protein AB0M80_38800 [Amycolatopsis sp. NPDC051045]|uniref:hypothetical protein n=1 Tax=Amycolatopsis sp. NPDC051045 TaxID=3156922 RepID=UPI00343D26A5